MPSRSGKIGSYRDIRPLAKPSLRRKRSLSFRSRKDDFSLSDFKPVGRRRLKWDNANDEYDSSLDGLRPGGKRRSSWDVEDSERDDCSFGNVRSAMKRKLKWHNANDEDESSLMGLRPRGKRKSNRGVEYSERQDSSFGNVSSVMKGKLKWDDAKDEDNGSLAFRRGRKRRYKWDVDQSERDNCSFASIEPRTKTKLNRDILHESEEDTSRPDKVRKRRKKMLSCDVVSIRDESSSERRSAADKKCEASDIDGVHQGNDSSDEHPLDDRHGEVINLVSDEDPDVVIDSSQRSIASVEMAWKMCIRQLENSKPDIFTGAEAKLQIVSKARQGTSVYEGIRVTEDNCLGLRAVLTAFKKSEGPKARSERAEKELVTTVSQFLRWSVASTYCSKLDVWKEETLFRSVAHMKLVERFLRYFQKRCEVVTARRKASHLMIVCDAAISSRMQQNIQEVSMVLQAICDKKGIATACRIQRGNNKWPFKPPFKRRAGTLSKTKLEPL